MSRRTKPDKDSFNLRDLCDKPEAFDDDVSGHILGSLWLKIVKELPLTWSVMNHKLAEWVNNPFSGIPNDNREKSSARGNAVKELARSDMSLKVFIKGIRIINPFAVHFAVGLEMNPRLVRWFTIRKRINELMPDTEKDVPHNVELEEKHKALIEDAKQQLATKLKLDPNRIQIHID